MPALRQLDLAQAALVLCMAPSTRQCIVGGKEKASERSPDPMTLAGSVEGLEWATRQGAGCKKRGAVTTLSAPYELRTGSDNTPIQLHSIRAAAYLTVFIETDAISRHSLRVT